MSADTQLTPHKTLDEELLEFVTWLFDDAGENATGTVDDHKRLISTYLLERL